MNFLYGVLVIAFVIVALKTVMKTAAALSRWFGLLIRIGRRWNNRRDQSLLSGVVVRPPHPGFDTSDWTAISRELRQAILARGVRVSRKLDRLDEAIEIEKREIELARLKAEKSQLKARYKSARSNAPSVKQAHGTCRPVIPIEQLEAMRKAARPGQSKQPSAPPLSPVHH